MDAGSIPAASTTPLVTAIDRGYLPGLKALFNSYQANAGAGFDFYCIVYGDDDLFAEVEALGVKAIRADWDTKYPVTRRWPNVLPSMYARLLIPQIFSEHDRAIWIDADCIIMDSLAPLLDMEFDEVVAGVYFDTANYTLGFHIDNLEPGLKKIRVPFSGLLVFNIQEWNSQDITGQCAELMNNPGRMDFNFVVQSVLGYVLKGRFHHMEYRWQQFAGRNEPVLPDIKIMHYVGALPWRVKMFHQDIWDKYA